MSKRPPGHGAKSVELVRQKSAYQRRRLLRALGVTRAELGPITLGYLDNYARVRVQLMLLDRWTAKHRPELVDEAGNPPPFSAFYTSLINAERNALRPLEEHLKRDLPSPDPMAGVRAWLEGDAEEEA